MLYPMVTLVDLVKRHVRQGYSKSGKFFGRTLMITFFDFILKYGNKYIKCFFDG